MLNFAYKRPATVAEAINALTDNPGYDILAGGTTMVDLMKIGVSQPEGLVDITGLKALEGYSIDEDVIRFGALANMAEVGDDKALKSIAPVLTESLWKAASPQLRNAARLGGNILQRTRCPYFREKAYACNKRNPGSGCAALDGGETTLHAIFGGSDACVAMYPGDWAQALIAFDAEVVLISEGGKRTIPFNTLHVQPADTPHIETVLKAGEIVVEIRVPKTPALANSHYLKARARESYAFADVSAAVGIALNGDTVSDARIALGGVASVPWRAAEAEDSLKGKPFNEEAAVEAGKIAFEGATPLHGSAYKIPLGASVIAGALITAHARATGTSVERKG